MTIVDLPYTDRRTAGLVLADRLRPQSKCPNLLVLALPRGGVPVAAEVARALGAPLDLMLVRKLGVPGQPEVAMGAIASGGVQVLNPGVVTTLGISEQTIDRIAAAEGRELERRARAYRGDRPPAVLAGRHVILIDDGLATGATMRAAATAARAQGPAGLVVAVPVAPEAALELLEPDIDELVCPATPEPFIAVSHWYEAFPQVGDEEVRALLEDAPDAEPTSQFASPHDGHGAAERHAGA